METWIMVRAKRARTAERPTQPSLDLRSRAPWFYPDLDDLGKTESLVYLESTADDRDGENQRIGRR